MQELVNIGTKIYKATEVYEAKPEPQDSVLRKASSVKQLQPLITSVMRITRQALNASASSILLCEEGAQRLVFMFADGPLGERVRRLRISKQSGIAGWVARNGKPLIVNDVSKHQCFSKYTDEVIGYTTKSIICVPLFMNQKVIGVIEMLNKLDGSGFDEHDLHALTVAAATAVKVMENFGHTRSPLFAYKITINALVSAVDAKETFTRGHSKRVSEYALMAANALSLSKEQKQTIEYAAIVHDIGKLAIPDSILNKSDALTDEEWKMIRRHPVTGFNMLRGIDFLEEASRLVLYHHERYDGKGYPKGLKGNAIPVGARLIAVADAFDTMTIEHTYRAARSKKEAFTELQKYAGSQFDPAAVKAFNSGFIRSYLSGKI